MWEYKSYGVKYYDISVKRAEKTDALVIKAS